MADKAGHDQLENWSFPWTSNITGNGLATSLVLIIICILIKKRYYPTQEEGKTHIRKYNLT